MVLINRQQLFGQTKLKDNIIFHKNFFVSVSQVYIVYKKISKFGAIKLLSIYIFSAVKSESRKLGFSFKRKQNNTHTIYKDLWLYTSIFCLLTVWFSSKCAEARKPKKFFVLEFKTFWVIVDIGFQTDRMKIIFPRV